MGRRNRVNASSFCKRFVSEPGIKLRDDRTEFTGQLLLPCLLNYAVI